MLVDDKSKPGELGLVITLNQKKKKNAETSHNTTHKKACIKKNTSKNKQKHTKSPAEGNDEFQTKASEPLEHRS